MGLYKCVQYILCSIHNLKTNDKILNGVTSFIKGRKTVLLSLIEIMSELGSFVIKFLVTATARTSENQNSTVRVKRKLIRVLVTVESALIYDSKG